MFETSVLEFEQQPDLDLSLNLLTVTGELPSELVLLSSLKTSNLSHNQLSGYIPNTFDPMSSLIDIDVRTV
ncbi:hypothetical protein GQ457_13G026390 [Hibiscus cannabinus]